MVSHIGTPVPQSGPSGGGDSKNCMSKFFKPKPKPSPSANQFNHLSVSLSDSLYILLT